MNRPGALLRAFAVHLFDPSAMERLIDPVIADLQCEHADAMRHGRAWHARWVRLASGIASAGLRGEQMMHLTSSLFVMFYRISGIRPADDALPKPFRCCRS